MLLVLKNLQHSQFSIKFLSWNHLPCELKFDLLTVQCTCIPQSTTVFSPSLELGPPNPHRVCPPPYPGTKEGGGYTLACGWGGGGVPIRTTGVERKLRSLPTLWCILFCCYEEVLVHDFNFYFSTSTFWSLMEPAVYRKAGGIILAQLQVPTGLNFATIDTV